MLYREAGKMAKIPATFEEVFGNGDPLFVYHGVGWFSKTILVPANWKGRTIALKVEKSRYRLELYINEKLAGYNIIPDAPVQFDIAEFLKPGEANRIAFRITNPGGQRGWNDNPVIPWGTKFNVSPGPDFGGIGGDVTLIAKAQCSIDDLFIKNILPANGKRIETSLRIDNRLLENKSLQVKFDIISCANKAVVFSKTIPFVAAKQSKSTLKEVFTVPDAKLWDTENPNLYYCKVSIAGTDTIQERFGFRVFEARANDKGQENYYLNGKRLRIRSSIDWGYYAQTGYYATDDMARKSVANAKAIGLNCLSFHRRIGDPLVIKYADEMGLLLYEEVGGMPGVDRIYISSWIGPKEKDYILSETMTEKFRRMMWRERNHPSVVIYNIVNESSGFDKVHKQIFKDAAIIDNSRMVVNQSGGTKGGVSGIIPHLRPYAKAMSFNYMDDHTVDAQSRFQEIILSSNQTENDSSIIHWGEVGCYCGPSNYYLLAQIKDTMGYDHLSWKPMSQKIAEVFIQNDFSKHPHIKSPADLTTQAGRSLMYTDGRYCQAAMASTSNDGFAINGWSDTNQSLGDDFFAWYSAICDEGRNLKGPASDFNYWTRELQLAVFRKNGKYFNPGETALFDIHLINESRLPAGDYVLNIKVNDGEGKQTSFQFAKTVLISAGEDYAQLLMKDFALKMDSNWHGGYITLECRLTKENKILVAGTEQVLLRNRPSYANWVTAKNIAVCAWPAALKAVLEANGKPLEWTPKMMNPNCILVGDVSNDNSLKQMLKSVKSGTTLIIRFDSLWSEKLLQHKILKQPVTHWGGFQKGFWNGNGWGYLDTFVGNQAIPSGDAVGTNSWEVPSDPRGFYPFVSNYPQKVHGIQFSRPDKLLVLLGSITYGKGQIILSPSYTVDKNEIFNDILFYNLIKNTK